MGKDQLDVNSADIMADIRVDDLPGDIIALFNSSQDFYLDCEKQKAEDLIAVHVANLSTISSKIGCIDDLIARLQSHREKLLSKKDQESKNVAMLKSILSPMRRVPMDVLCEIFLRCLPETSTMAPRNVLKESEAPLLLCQVCAKWRRMAIAFPPLWKALTLRLNYSFDDETGLIIRVHPSVWPILDSWFSRAGSCPVSLGLDLENEGVDPTELTLKLEDAVNRLPSSRLQHLSLSAFHPSDTYFLSNISKEFTELESIFLEAVSGTDSMTVPYRLLQSAPRLRYAELHNLISPWEFPKSLIPWAQLTHLHIEDQLGERMWYILICHCPGLRHGIFSIDQDSANAPTIPNSDRYIVLPHLVDLTVYVTKYGEKPDFRQLVFPALKKLQLLFEGPISADSTDLRDGHFLTTDTIFLNSLVIMGAIDFTQPQLRSLLDSMSSITALRLSVRSSYTDFFRTLSSPSQPQQLVLPKLEALHCDIRDLEDADTILPSIISFVRSRCWDELSSSTTRTPARLRRLTLKFHANQYEVNFMIQANQILAPFIREKNLSFVLDIWRGHLKLREMMRFEQE